MEERLIGMDAKSTNITAGINLDWTIFDGFEDVCQYRYA